MRVWLLIAALGLLFFLYTKEDPPTDGPGDDIC